MLPIIPILTGGIVLLAVNLIVYVNRMHGRSRSCRSARDFCAVSFVFFLAALFALLDLTTQVWVDPSENLALAILKSTGGGLAISTASALGFCMAARLD
ncbi:MAG: hypothetical protein GAK28_04003 [Luteibacter sp.]|uniref:hypothetical protein n=1 Tax=Luteibacter sp. TaxID=1886636 RepID=UPI001380768C|nr:hypothetical protein [Luteibacter sp.]KAF1004481.1 MAG: hypothetical protein GAK28_04003 [Luteibacter sp.]